MTKQIVMASLAAYPPHAPQQQYLDDLGAFVSGGFQIVASYIAPATLPGQSPAVVFILKLERELP